MPNRCRRPPSTKHHAVPLPVKATDFAGQREPSVRYRVRCLAMNPPSGRRHVESHPRQILPGCVCDDPRHAARYWPSLVLLRQRPEKLPHRQINYADRSPSDAFRATASGLQQSDQLLPSAPCDFIAASVDFPMVSSTQGDGELIADLSAEGRLCAKRR